VVSANTDGVTVLALIADRARVEEVVSEWERVTGLEMEYTEYAALHQKDVNNYCALTTTGTLKTKGGTLSEFSDFKTTSKFRPLF